MYLLKHAINNNAVWCDTVCCAHNAPGEFRENLWINRHPVPMFYSNILRLSEQGEEHFRGMIRELLASNLPKPWSIKDGFGTLDLHDLGFRKLFDASWIMRLPDNGTPALTDSDIRWSTIEDEADLIAWEAAWSGNDANITPDQQPRLWVPAILHDPDVTFLARRVNGEIVAVGIANRTGNVVGLSNVFARSTANINIWPGIITKTTELFPDLPIVGYERDDDLIAALGQGFATIGDLSIWIVE